MSSRELILEKLCKGFLPGRINQSIITLPEIRSGEMDLFMTKATAAAAQVTRTTTREVHDVVKAILHEIGSKSIILSDERIVQELGIHSMASDMGITCQYVSEISMEDYRSRMFQAEVGVSSCDYALADSGSLVIKHGSENQRMISLAPNHYIGIVKASQMLKDRFDLASILEKEEKTSAISIITGVSRTADVALQVVLGMHGPRKVYIVLIEE